MKAVILAGGLGSRLAEETMMKPKPMVEIGGMPILWHIMKIYSHYGINEFIICLGYKGNIIKDFFANYFLHTSDVTFDMSSNQMQVLNNKGEPWKVTLIETGQNTETAGRVKKIQDYILPDSEFCLTYGDGLADVDIEKLIDFHLKHKKLATLTAVSPPGRFGSLVTESDRIVNFTEKPRGDGAMINGGFFVLSSKIFDLISGDNESFENKVLVELTASQELMSFKHLGFWKAMDTLRDKITLEDLWNSGQAPWKIW
jgi:glucose-1-phosphate cytidylyltransferase